MGEICERVRSDFEKLIGCPLVALTTTAIPKLPGVYVLYECGNPIYVGRTGRGKRNLRKQVHDHYEGDHNKASFAVKRARERTGKKPTYRKGEGLKDLIRNDQEFVTAFDAARKRIAGMQIRWVTETDQDVRYQLEFYAAKELGTPYNSFQET